jgi:CheY-like chemotaxis protein/DNA-binding Xre family transcriptional regulator
MWRSQLGISQEELAERADLHRTYISDIERGARNISLESIGKLAAALDISVSALFPEEVPITKPRISKSNGRDRNLVDILLVEDNPDDVELTLQAFKKACFANRMHVAGDGAAALDYLFCRGEYAHRRPAEYPQLILLDLNLPKIDGLEVLRSIKAEKQTRMIPVVVLTISQMFSDMEECRQLGAETYLVKPVSFERLSRITPQLNLCWALFKPAGTQLRNIRL